MHWEEMPNYFQHPDKLNRNISQNFIHYTIELGVVDLILTGTILISDNSLNEHLNPKQLVEHASLEPEAEGHFV
jgi:hypothetical protein